MTWPPVRAILRKDLIAMRRDRSIVISLIATPIIVLVLLPIIMVGGAGYLSLLAPIVRGGLSLEVLSGHAAVPLVTGAAAVPVTGWVVFVLEVFFVPLFLLVPMIGTTVLASHTFAGERDRDSLEGLLHTSITERELMAGKFLAAWIPAVAVSSGGFVLYAVTANVLGWSTFGHVFFPTRMWVLLAGFVAPGISAFGLALMVVASSRVRSSQAAHQIGSLLVLPLIVVVNTQVTAVVLLAPGLVALLGAAIWASAGGTLLLGGSVLHRSRLATLR